MKKLLLLSLVLAGCGGSGIESEQPPQELSAGTWTGQLKAGSWRMPPPPNGPADLALDITAGVVTGTATQSSEVGTVTGTIQNGVVNLAVDYPNQDDWTVFGTAGRRLRVKAAMVAGSVQLQAKGYDERIAIRIDLQ